MVGLVDRNRLAEFGRISSALYARMMQDFGAAVSKWLKNRSDVYGIKTKPPFSLGAEVFPFSLVSGVT
jgi:hypothetical protein